MSVFVGIDVSKKHLDVFVRPTSEAFRVENTVESIAGLTERLKAASPALVVFESTGGYERDASFAMVAAGLPVVVVNARQIRDFAKATGKLAKTDEIDARVIAEFGAVVRPALRDLTLVNRELDEKLLRRRQLVDMRSQERTRLHQARGQVKQSINNMLQHLNAEIRALEDDLDNELRQRMEAKLTLLLSVPGVGNETARTLLIELPELGTLTRREVASLVGLAPLNHDSGGFRGQRRIRGGRAAVRRVLYLAAFSGRRCNPALKRAFERLRASGKPMKVCMIACTRKLLVILNAMMRDHRVWQPELALEA